jgi:hypothetical protein
MTKIISGDYTGFSDPISDGLFIIPYKDLKEEVFNPVIEGIISSIKLAKGTLDDELDGIFLSGRIGQDDNLQKILRATFGTADIKVTSILSAFSVSEGAIAFALRKRGLQIPYLIGDSLEKTQRTFKQGNELTGGGQLYNEDSIIDSGDSDYVIGLGTHFFLFKKSDV